MVIDTTRDPMQNCCFHLGSPAFSDCLKIQQRGSSIFQFPTQSRFQSPSIRKLEATFLCDCNDKKPPFSNNLFFRSAIGLIRAQDMCRFTNSWISFLLTRAGCTWWCPVPLFLEFCSRSSVFKRQLFIRWYLEASLLGSCLARHLWVGRIRRTLRFARCHVETKQYLLAELTVYCLESRPSVSYWFCSQGDQPLCGVLTSKARSLTTVRYVPSRNKLVAFGLCLTVFGILTRKFTIFEVRRIKSTYVSFYGRRSVCLFHAFWWSSSRFSCPAGSLYQLESNLCMGKLVPFIVTSCISSALWGFIPLTYKCHLRDFWRGSISKWKRESGQIASHWTLLRQKSPR